MGLGGVALVQLCLSRTGLSDSCRILQKMAPRRPLLVMQGGDQGLFTGVPSPEAATADMELNGIGI